MQLAPHSLEIPFRRPIALLASLVVGLIGSFLLASPASAHDARISGQAVCDSASGDYIVTWTVTNDYDSVARRGRVEVFPKGTRVDLPREIPPAYGDLSSITGIQRVPGNAGNSATLRLDKVSWEDGYTQDYDLSQTVEFGAPCQATPPQPPEPKCVNVAQAKFTHTFTPAKGSATVSLAGALPLCAGTWQDFSLSSYTAPPGFKLPQGKFDSDTGILSPKTRKITLKVDLPACHQKVYLSWGSGVLNPLTARSQYGSRLLGSPARPGSQSAGPRGEAQAGTVACATKPAVTFEDTCQRVEITLANSGNVPIAFQGAAKAGRGAFKAFGKPVVVAPNQKKTFGVDGVAGLVVKVAAGSLSEEHAWVEPAGCEANPEPSPSGPPGGPKPPGDDGSGLPVTGASLGLLIASALAATGAGSALVFWARKRRRAYPSATPEVAG